MSGWAISSAALAAFTDPPYWIRTAAAASAPFMSADLGPDRSRTPPGRPRRVAVRPVPIAQMGS